MTDDEKVLNKKIREDKIAHIKHCEVDIDKEYQTGKAKRIYLRQCYEKALDYAWSLPKEVKGNVKIVHGTLKHDRINSRYDHAWVEINNFIVFDGVMQRFYDKECYYEIHGAVKEAEYTTREAAEAVRKHDYIGPWHKIWGSQ